MLVGRSSPFGGKTRTRVLIALRSLNESFPRELARILAVPLNGVLQALKSLESDGLVSGRSRGRTRLYRVNPRYFAYPDLQAYLARLVEGAPELKGRIAALRRRPRRTAKPL
jgi:DNA-binding transcriptional ArsR family regulator